MSLGEVGENVGTLSVRATPRPTAVPTANKVANVEVAPDNKVQVNHDSGHKRVTGRKL